MMKPYFCLLLLALAGSAQAYTIPELREDCLAATELLEQKKNNDMNEALKGARCISYVAGFADGYAVSNYLAEKIGVDLNAICLPKDDKNLSRRLVRAVLAHLETLPRNPGGSTATIVASALSKTFNCPNSLEPKK